MHCLGTYVPTVPAASQCRDVDKTREREKSTWDGAGRLGRRFLTGSAMFSLDETKSPTNQLQFRRSIRSMFVSVAFPVPLLPYKFVWAFVLCVGGLDGGQNLTAGGRCKVWSIENSQTDNQRQLDHRSWISYLEGISTCINTYKKGRRQR